jgi:hypothetical protein
VEAHPIASFHVADLGTDFLNDAGNLMSQRQRERTNGGDTSTIMRVGVTDTSRLDTDEYILFTDTRCRYFLHLQGLPCFHQANRFHRHFAPLGYQW